MKKITGKFLYNKNYYKGKDFIIAKLRKCRNEIAKEFIRKYDAIMNVNIIKNEVKNKGKNEENNDIKEIREIVEHKNIFDIDKKIFQIQGKNLISFYDIEKNTEEREIWTCGKEIADILEYSNTVQATIDHVSFENKKTLEE